MTTTVL